MTAEVTNLAGRVIGKYALQRVIGNGGMAVVYQALHTDFDLPVAVKLILPALAGEAGIRARFRREARLLFQLRHPHLVRVWELVEEGDLFGMAMDWVEGQDLRTYLRSLTQALSIQELKQIFLPVLSAVGHAHSHKVIHRDIKPSNILLEITSQGLTPKVMDFGIAKSLEGSESSTQLHTATSSVLGTPHYTAPEQIQGASLVDHRADIYSLGVTLYQMLTGRLPFQHKTSIQQVLFAQVMEHPPRPSEIAADLPQLVEDVILTALQKEPAKRFPSCDLFAAALVDALHHSLDTKRLTSSFQAIQEAVLADSGFDAQNPRLSASSTPPPRSIPRDALPTSTGESSAFQPLLPPPKTASYVPNQGKQSKAVVVAVASPPRERLEDIAFSETMTPSHLKKMPDLAALSFPPSKAVGATPIPASERLLAEPLSRPMTPPTPSVPSQNDSAASPPRQRSPSAEEAAPLVSSFPAQTEEAPLPLFGQEEPEASGSPTKRGALFYVGWSFLFSLLLFGGLFFFRFGGEISSTSSPDASAPLAPPLSDRPSPSLGGAAPLLRPSNPADHPPPEPRPSLRLPASPEPSQRPVPSPPPTRLPDPVSQTPEPRPPRKKTTPSRLPSPAKKAQKRKPPPRPGETDPFDGVGTDDTP